jgi:hypothetical protein
MASPSARRQEVLACSVGYEPIDAGRVPHLQSPLAPAAWQPSNTADGSIVSTAPDLCAYARMVLAHGDPLHGVTTPVPNLTRIVVQGGAGHFPLEYLRVTIDPRQQDTPFSAERCVPRSSRIRPDDGLAVAICQNGAGVKAVLGATRWMRSRPRSPANRSRRSLHPAAGRRGGRGIARRRVPFADRAVELEASLGVSSCIPALAVRLEHPDEDLDVFVAPHPALDRFVLRDPRCGRLGRRLGARSDVVRAGGARRGTVWRGAARAAGARPGRPLPGRCAMAQGAPRLRTWWRPVRRICPPPRNPHSIPLPDGCFALDSTGEADPCAVPR